MEMHIYASPDDIPDQYSDCVSFDHKTNMWWFHHQFYVGFFPVIIPYPLSEHIKKRSEAAQRAYERRSWSEYLLRHERGWRLDRLIDLAHDGAVDTSSVRECVEFWRSAAWAWTDGELAEDDCRWEAVLQAPIPYLPAMSGIDGRRLYRSLPDTITIYRGVHSASQDEARLSVKSGVQWSLSRRVAGFFANRFLPSSLDPYVASAEAPKDKIVAVLLGRGEREIVVRAEHCTIKRISLAKRT